MPPTLAAPTTRKALRRTCASRRAYSPEALLRLMRQGVGLGDRKLGVMSGWAKAYFSHFTDAEIQALYRYLHDLPEPAGH